MSCKQCSENYFYLFKKNFPFNNSFEYFYYLLLSILFHTRKCGGKIPWPGQLGKSEKICHDILPTPFPFRENQVIVNTCTYIMNIQMIVQWESLLKVTNYLWSNAAWSVSTLTFSLSVPPFRLHLSSAFFLNKLSIGKKFIHVCKVENVRVDSGETAHYEPSGSTLFAKVCYVHVAGKELYSVVVLSNYV